MSSEPDHWRLSERGRSFSDSAIRALAKRIAGRSDIVSLAGGMPSPATFPQAEFSRAFDVVMQRDGVGALQYGPTDGHGPLREWIAQSLCVPGRTIGADQVLIVSGSQQGLDLIGKVLLDRGDVVGVETPTYLGALQALGQYFPRFVSLRGDDEGLLPDQIEASLRGSPASPSALRPLAKLVYSIPTFQNPTGRTLSLQRRVDLVEVCARLRVPLIEDDPYGALDHEGQPHTRCLSLDAVNVIYLGSFSKILSPGIRLGYLVGPAPVVRRLEMAKQASDLHSSSLAQRLVFEIVRSGFLDHHLAACQALYRTQAQALARALDKHLTRRAHWVVPRGGMFQWLELAHGADATALLEPALAAGVAYVPGAPFYADQPQRHTLRLCFSTCSAADLEHAISALARVLPAHGEPA